MKDSVKLRYNHGKKTIELWLDDPKKEASRNTVRDDLVVILDAEERIIGVQIQDFEVHGGQLNVNIESVVK